MLNRNQKRNELRAALNSGDPYAIAKAFYIKEVAPKKSPSEPNPPDMKEPINANGIDFTTIAKLLLDTCEYAAHVRWNSD